MKANQKPLTLTQLSNGFKTVNWQCVKAWFTIQGFANILSLFEKMNLF